LDFRFQAEAAQRGVFVGRPLRTGLIAALVVVLAGGSTWYLWQNNWSFGQSKEPVRGRSSAAAVVPVQAATVSRRDLPIYLTGLGTVQASSTVAIRSQVDGTLQDVLFTEGQQVHKGDALAKIDPRLYQAALDQAQAKKAQDEALLVSAQKDLERFRTLVAKNVETVQILDQQQAKVDQLIASMKADAAAIETAQTQLDYTTIKASSDGRMGVRTIDAGNFVRAADATAVITTLTLTKPAAVLFTLSARWLGDVREAMARGPVEVEALSQDNAHVLGTGTLLLIDNIVDQTSATMRLKAMFANDDGRLWPGDFVNARLLLERRHDVLTVPPAAVQRGPNGIFAWVVMPGDVVQVRMIESGPTTGDQTVIVSGLSEGERVVVNGQYKLQQNAKVTVNEPSAPTTPAAAKRDRAS
jgi:multidrug efflux system membrane fusion protein